MHIMSHGPGALQKRILAELESVPGERLELDSLKRRFRGVDRSNLRRAIESLKRMGELSDYVEDGVRWIELPRELDPSEDEWLASLLLELDRRSPVIPSQEITDEVLNKLLEEINRREIYREAREARS